MHKTVADYRLFFRQFRENFQSTGAIAPSGRFLAAALSRYVEGGNHPRRILEVGPGTGAVTARIVRCLRPDDQLDLVELNESFVAHLRQRFATEPDFQAVAAQAQILHQRLEELPAEPVYDLIVSGLPLNNFPADLVRTILSSFEKLLKPGGTLSFFEYMAVRPARSLVSNRQERDRLRQVGKALGELLSGREIRCDWVLPNFPPAYVHHVRLSETVTARSAS